MRYLTLGVFALLLCSSGAHAQQGQRPAAGGNKSEQRTTDKTPRPLNAVAEHARKSGAVRCVEKLDQFSQFLTRDSQSGAVLFMPQKEIDSQMISASFEVLSKESTAYASVTTAPRWNGCGGMYETVVYWPFNCETVAMKQFAGMKPVGSIKQNIAILGETPNLRVFLMPAGQNCVSIKKEVVH